MLMTSELKSVNDIVIIKLCEVSLCDESKRSKAWSLFSYFQYSKFKHQSKTK